MKQSFEDLVKQLKWFVAESDKANTPEKRDLINHAMMIHLKEYFDTKENNDA